MTEQLTWQLTFQIMTFSRSVTSNQAAIHDDLMSILDKHVSTNYSRPIPEVAQQTFDECQKQLAITKRPLILDSGCGVGRSTQILANKYPEHWVIGIDQSVHRLSKAERQELPVNMLLIRANLVDFWRLAETAGWRLDKQYLLYPNPWPKKNHLKRRWHGHPVFPTLLKLGGILELRTNWGIYADEMAMALKHAGVKQVDVEQFEPHNYLTPFEEKYHRSKQPLYQLTADLS